MAHATTSCSRGLRLSSLGLGLALALVACGDQPGEVSLIVYDPEDGDKLWSRRFDVANASVSTAPDDGDRLLLDGYDNCPDTHTVVTLEARTGAGLQYLVRGDGESSEAFGQGQPCPVTELSSGERRALCVPDGNGYRVLDPDTQREVFHVDAPDFSVFAAGDHLLVARAAEDGVTLIYEWLSFTDGSLVWASEWEEPAIGHRYLGHSDDKLLFLDGDVSTVALSTEDGELAWQRDMHCNNLDVAAGVLACIHQEAESECPDDS